MKSWRCVIYFPSGAIAWQNKATVYGLLFKAASEAMLAIAADPKHLRARIGMTAVLHTWGSALTHHPHVHMIVPGGGLSPDGQRFVPSRRRFFLPVRVLSRLFRRLMLEKLAAAYDQGIASRRNLRRSLYWRSESKAQVRRGLPTGHRLRPIRQGARPPQVIASHGAIGCSRQTGSVWEGYADLGRRPLPALRSATLHFARPAACLLITA